MANVKMSFIGLLDMLRFKNMKVQRDRIIESTPALALVENYASNQNAAARHPLSQFFTIEDIQVRGKGDVKTFTLRRNDDQNPAFFRAGQFVVIRQMIDGKLIARPVTLSCGPAMTLEGKVQLTVKRVEEDAFLSAYIHDNWKVGDTVETSGPQGTFFYEPLRDAKKVVAIAGGSGITPVYAMANAIADGDEDFEIVDQIAPKEEEKVFVKTINSCFGNQEFKEYMEHQDDKRLMIIGLQTNYCIDCTVKSAFEKGFQVIIPEGTNSTFENDYMSGETTCRYYNEFMWPGRFAECIPFDEAIGMIKK